MARRIEKSSRESNDNVALINLINGNKIPHEDQTEQSKSVVSSHSIKQTMQSRIANKLRTKTLLLRTAFLSFPSSVYLPSTIYAVISCYSSRLSLQLSMSTFRATLRFRDLLIFITKKVNALETLRFRYATLCDFESSVKIFFLFLNKK